MALRTHPNARTASRPRFKDRGLAPHMHRTGPYPLCRGGYSILRDHNRLEPMPINASGRTRIDGHVAQSHKTLAASTTGSGSFTTDVPGNAHRTRITWNSNALLKSLRMFSGSGSVNFTFVPLKLATVKVRPQIFGALGSKEIPVLP